MYFFTKRTALLPLIFIATIAVLGFATRAQSAIEEPVEAPHRFSE